MNENLDLYPNTSQGNLSFEIRTHQGEEDEMISCYIPMANLYFSANSWEEVNKRASIMIKSFISFWNQRNKDGILF